MGIEILTFGDIEIEKNNFYRHIRLLFFFRGGGAGGGDEDIEQVLVSNKIFFDEKHYKYFIGYLFNDDKVNPLHIMLPKTSAYVKSYDGQTKWMYMKNIKSLMKNNFL